MFKLITVFILSLVCLASCISSVENSKIETEVVSEFVKVNPYKSSAVRSVNYYKSIDELSLTCKDELHIDSITYPYIKREQMTESYTKYTYVFDAHHKLDFYVGWDKFNECYYKMKDHEQKVQFLDEFYGDSIRLKVYSVEGKDDYDYFIDSITIESKFESLLCIPKPQGKGYRSFDFWNVDKVLSKFESTKSTKITYELSGNNVIKHYLKSDHSRGVILEEKSTTYNLKGYDLFWFKNFPNAFDEVK